MDKKNLQNILANPFTIPNWRDVLVSVFGVKRLHQNPIPIDINKKEKAEAAFELGSFNTSDDRIIGLYLVKVKPEVWLERNKVGLREMLRSVYKHDVDGALIVFEQKDKWRLSFVSEIRVFDENGKISKKATEPKRYTYLLGAGEKVKTPATRLASLSGKPFSLEDIRNAFSVEALNEEFYKVVARYFYQLVGATEGKGAKAITHERLLELPGIKPDDKEGHKIYQEFAVRLIGRTVFCWFLKVKKSDKGVALLPEHLLSSTAVASNNNYYHFILEKLFFQTLNTPMDDRIKGLPKGSEQIPFLNGGLFEPQTEDYYKPNRSTGLSDNLNTLKIPDSWFKEFFEHLEQYNFTIDENSVVDIEVSVDPEMLGRIFENLLAEIDPDSGETARKATGSFYTPREIVDYMATESLVHYLHNQTKIDKESLQPIFKMDSEVSFSKAETEKILEALDRLKILDPACGSGAFPIGVMQKIVMALQKLDKDAVWWKAKQIQRIENAILRKQVKQKLEQTTVEYARKIGIIQNSLYGVDIQPVAAEISKLRCFLTLVVDENIDESKPNRGVEPLPNLEFKFVTADALLKLPPETKDHGTGDLFSNSSELEELQQIRLDYLQSYGDHKEELKQRFLDLQKAIFKQQLKYGAKENSRAYQISSWNPFGHDKVDWFDPLWMYGVKEFDIVIANPPYVLLQEKLKEIDSINYFKDNYSVASYKIDLYHLFIERGIKLLAVNGVFAYINPANFLSNNYTVKLRQFILSETELRNIVNISENVFTANVNTCILIAVKSKNRDSMLSYNSGSIQNGIFSVKEVIRQKQANYIDDKSLLIPPGDETTVAIIKKIESKSELLSQYAKVNFGMQLRDRKKYPKDVLDNPNKTELTMYHKKCYTGRDIGKYSVTYNGLYCYFNTIAKQGGCWDESVHFQKNKILVRQVGEFPVGGLDQQGFAVLNSAFMITTKTINPKFILAQLNSSLLKFYWMHKYADKRKTFPKIKGGYLELLPIINSKSDGVFNILIDYILFLKSLNDKTQINEYVPNSHIIQLFEEVIDALVFELFFEEDFAQAKVSIKKFADRDFKDIENKSEKDSIRIIHTAYQKLREKDNEIRQNLKLIDTRLPDLIMPIKNSY